jgi:hypothetical protein
MPDTADLALELPASLEGFTRITGIVHAKHCSNPYAGGQVLDHAKAVVEPARGLDLAEVHHLTEVWDRWHLNGMRAACAHQQVKWEQSDYGLRPSLTLTEPCAESGYRYGSAWLVEPLPTDVLAYLAEFVKHAPPHH